MNMYTPMYTQSVNMYTPMYTQSVNMYTPCVNVVRLLMTSSNAEMYTQVFSLQLAYLTDDNLRNRNVHSRPSLAVLLVS